MSGTLEVEGAIRGIIEVRICPNQFKDWAPDEILRFFEGIARALRAAGNGNSEVTLRRD